MSIWVTGGNGFIGRHLIGHLAREGESVYGVGHGTIEEMDRQQLGLMGWINGEISAPNLDDLVQRGGAPTAIFHLAGGSSVARSIEQPYEDFSRTVVATASLLEWLRHSARECRLIVASSAAVYGARHAGSIPEQATTQPMSPYGHHKLIMEQLCRSYADSFGVHATIVRLFSVYGSSLRKQLLWDLCLRLSRGQRELVLGGTGNETRDWTDVRDVVRLLAGLAQADGAPLTVLNGGSGVPTSVAEIANMVAKAWGGDIAVRFSGIVRAGDPFSLIADAGQLAAIPFSWRIPVQDGIAQYVSWFKGQAR
ncbi:NAD-dependent epimerase/dehydratase family protein [Bradyrhizobium diazoefficiens]|uniref:UDP-glucose 4-epimerase n=1 Tax=Bradyrhizobium diazoefficiens TaxID=1355477 RepID=A0A809X8K7_9BRAD|nr:SDR family oxidoreductase [Bradyrhizobium diazoefficiens]WLA76837.1 SDR family oxidoreductase [Bradyrhizobium diazoefficiens]BCE23807.1 UDP-glucose 4-epimerase [Bradyrhizobium diazoefficiens]BCE50066.1 UDP-glucose 4-epimerase [Bradyrhizobium diazoefficiens]BCE93575.1 UDP-glucose 4-epimerase [Bradyrhizobium diazoefficiens]BCF28511.1 UDP-glucose 4-epimerase [Bradyrhizobium diazoefficiens]